LKKSKYVLPRFKNEILNEIHDFHYLNYPNSKIKIGKLIRKAKEEIHIHASILKLSLSKVNVQFDSNFKKDGKKNFLKL
jgi:hypothetical protein